MPGGFIGKLNKKWTVALSEGGELYISGFLLTYKGQKADLTMNYNAGKEHRFPLQIAVENMDLYSVSIYDENGELNYDMRQFEEAPSPGKIDIPDWSSTIEELKRLGKIGLNDNSGLMPKDDSRGFADSFSNGKIGNIKMNKNIIENFDQFCSRFLYESVSDDEYLMAVDADDMETAQKMVDDSAKAAGYNIGPVWRGDKISGITTYDISKQSPFAKLGKAFYFSEDENEARIHQGIGGSIRRFFLKPKNKAKNFAQLDNGDWDTAGPLSLDQYNHYVWAIKASNQIKSADPVTRDDHGNIIPLSQRFDSSKDDIRY
jgi:hypothetical protein